MAMFKHSLQRYGAPETGLETWTQRGDMPIPIRADVN